ncbi:MAG: protein phosphatase 2C domain-containing protein [Defluviitaleaceae bacterium]|nr:protein phosphatase 2C domain-containing protein [Defluviitaleaceae bacterium]
MKVSSAGKSHIGKVREQNQDTIFTNDDGIGVLLNLYVVADGLGGHQSGEVASRRATEAFCAFFVMLEDGHSTEDSEQELLAAALAYANQKVFDDATNVVENKGMGTTFSAVTIKNGILHYAHVGDSRIYISKNDGELIQVTTDHLSVTAELLEEGFITQDEAKKYPETVLSRAIGTDFEVKIDMGETSLDGAKYAILCSDGLHNMITDDEIANIVASESNLETMTGKLTAAANNAGGKDNISVIVIGWGEL